MYPFVKPRATEVRVEHPTLKGELPMDNDAMFETLMRDNLVTGPDMTVEGNWTQGTIADSFSMMEMVSGIRIDWSKYRSVDWTKFKRGEELSEAQGFFPVKTAADLESSFGAGDPGLGSIRCGNGYHIQGRAGRTTNLMVGRTTVATARPGQKAVAYNCPRDVDIAQLINRFDWGYQSLIVAAILRTLPTLGESANWRIPSFGTVGPRRSMTAAYNFTYGIPIGVPIMTSRFDIKSSRSRTYTFTMRNIRGEPLASSDVEMERGDNRVFISFTAVPSTGIISIESHGVSYTITDTDATPPVI